MRHREPRVPSKKANGLTQRKSEAEGLVLTPEPGAGIVGSEVCHRSDDFLK